MMRRLVRTLMCLAVLGVIAAWPLVAQRSALAFASPLPTPTSTVSSPLPTPTRVPPTATRVQPTATYRSPTSTPVPPTATPGSTPTNVPPTATRLPPTATRMMPTATRIAPTPTGVPGAGLLGYHVVRSGETLYCIARAYVVLPSAIASTNGIAYPYPISVLQLLAIPNVTWQNMPGGPTCQRQFTSACRVTYIVRSGDTLYSIAVRYQTTVAALVRDNYIANPTVLFPGQKLCIR